MERSNKIGLGVFALLLVGALTWSQAEPPQAAPAEPVATAFARLASVSTEDRRRIDYAALDARLKRLIAEPAMVGLTVGVVENGRITFLSGYGETVAKSGEKVTPDTVFRWASVSKGVAATMVAKLEEEGKLSFDSPVAQFAASLKLPGGAEHRATIGDLLSHRLGLYRNAYDNKLEEGQDTRALRTMLSELNLICPPGTCWSYQNVAYDGSSEIIEGVTGKSFERALRDRLFNPIGMTSASVTREGLMQSPSWARPHSSGKTPLEVTDAYYRVPAAGGVNSDIKDMALWMIAQMGEMPGILSPQLLQAIHAPLVKTPGERRRLRKFLERLGQADYGYGWRGYDYAGHRIIGHRGGLNGYRSLILFDPQLKSGVVAMWNSNTSQPGGLEFEVMDMLYGLPFRDWMELGGGPVPDIVPRPVEPEPDPDAIAARTARTANAPS